MSDTKSRQRYMDRMLILSIKEKDLRYAEQLLAKNACPNALHDDASALHIASGSEDDDPDFVRLLLEYGANPNLSNSDGTTPLHTAASYGNARILKLLLGAGGDPSFCDFDGSDAFYWASESGSVECCELLELYKGRDQIEDGIILGRSKDGITKYNSHSLNFSKEDSTKLSSATQANSSPSQKSLQASSSFYESPMSLKRFENISLSDDEESATMSDFTVVTELSDQSSCSLHSVRRERVIFSNPNYSLLEVLYSADDAELDNSSSHYCSCLNESVESAAPSDWKEPLTPDETTDRISIPDSVKALTDSELRRRLQQFDERPGPIVRSTRRMYEMKLAAFLKGKRKSGKTQPEFPAEVMLAVSGSLDRSSLDALEAAMTDPFQQADPEKKWREGLQKSSFNYLLLDPRILQNLPARAKHMNQEESFSIFLRAVFYIGKGKRSRPYEHFKEAASHFSGASKQAPSRKVEQILNIWKASLGVVSLCAFQNTIPVEAFTREACMIDALGLDNLTNKCRGQLYGPASSWSSRDVRKLGAWLLKKSYSILLNEGERQIRFQDIGKT